MPSSRELLEAAEQVLADAGVGSPRADAELLLAHVTNRPRALLRLAGDVPAGQAGTFTALVGERARRVPLQHLTGTAPFRYLELAVGPGVFVPRPETELLVDAVLTHLRDRAPDAEPDAKPDSDSDARRTRGTPDRVGPVLVDLCTGSGALALALATEVPRAEVHAVESDPEAAAWTKRNLDRSAEDVARAGSRVSVIVADATCAAGPEGPLAELTGLVDAVVSNPPYVPDDAIPRDPEVRDHDPAQALYGGPDGLTVIRRLIAQAALLLRPGGLLVIEHADLQGDEAGPGGVPGVLRLLPDWNDVTDHRDLAGLPRYTTALRTRPRA